MEQQEMMLSMIDTTLRKNGFKRDKNNIYELGECSIQVDLEEQFYRITSSKGVMHSEDLNLYFILGFLSAEKLIRRDFEI